MIIAGYTVVTELGNALRKHLVSLAARDINVSNARVSDDDKGHTVDAFFTTQGGDRYKFVITATVQDNALATDSPGKVDHVADSPMVATRDVVDKAVEVNREHNPTAVTETAVDVLVDIRAELEKLNDAVGRIRVV